MNNFIAISNNKYKRKGKTRHHNTICYYCKNKYKNIHYHYKKYHPEVLEGIIKALGKGQIGVISGVSFFKS